MRKLFTIIFVLAFTLVNAGEVDDLIQKGTELRDAWKEAESFPFFKKAVALDSNNVEALHNLSFLYGALGDRKPDKDVQRAWLEKAVYLGKKAKTLNPTNAEAHYSYLVGLGRLSEIAGSAGERVKNAKDIESSCLKVIELDPSHAGGHHVLGRWHHEIMELAWYEKAAINLLFGGAPEHASYEEAERLIKKAISLRPGHLLYYYDLARLYDDMDREEDAIKYCKKALSMPIITPDDADNKKDAKELLDDLD